jgi:hypothetical protein
MTGIPLPPASVGLTLSFAYLVKQDIGGGVMAWTFASNPEPVEIVASIPGS